LDPTVIALLQQMTAENHTWRAKRIQGELRKLGVRVARSTLQQYMRRLRPPRSRSQSWSTFLYNHAHAIWACDLLHTDDLFFRAVFGFVIIDHASRRIVHARVTRHPTDAWLAQQIREATPFDIGPRFLIRDNDGTYGHRFDRAVAAAGITPIRIPPHAPKANALCERFWGSLRRECLDHLIILNERHLRHVVHHYMHYYNAYRPHQGIDQHIPCGGALPNATSCVPRVVAKPILSGLHHHYYRDVA
jgi:transposase InsO family protein